jgi:uncharacterized protein YaaW (UPF0174 family)
MLEYLENNNIMKIDKDDLTMMCKYLNISGVSYKLSEENTILTKEQKSALFGCTVKKKTKLARSSLALKMKE